LFKIIQSITEIAAMTTLTAELLQRSVSPRSVEVDGRLTLPRSWGVYRLPVNGDATRQFRFGNHPIRMLEIKREFGSCKLEYLFLERADAIKAAAALNRG
jgi:hypothetical protein